MYWGAKVTLERDIQSCIKDSFEISGTGWILSHLANCPCKDTAQFCPLKPTSREEYSSVSIEKFRTRKQQIAKKFFLDRI